MIRYPGHGKLFFQQVANIIFQFIEFPRLNNGAFCLFVCLRLLMWLRHIHGMKQLFRKYSVDTHGERGELQKS